VGANEEDATCDLPKMGDRNPKGGLKGFLFPSSRLENDRK